MARERRAEPGAVVGTGARTTHSARARFAPGALVAVALGGALGAPARYGVAQLIVSPAARFPWATFWTNISGSAVLGCVLALLVERFPPGRYLRAFVATGFLGSYTTFSTFIVESDLLVRDGRALLALTYCVASLLAGLVAMVVGLGIGRRVPLRARR
jgi:CrcB protein